MYPSMVRKNIGHNNELLRIIGETYCPLPLGKDEDPIVSEIVIKSEIVVFIYDINRIGCLLYIITDNLDL